MSVFHLRVRQMSGVESMLVDWPYSVYPRHARIAHEVLAVVEGTIQAVTPNGRSTLSTGDAIVFCPFEPHDYTIVSGTARFLSVIHPCLGQPVRTRLDERIVRHNVGILSSCSELSSKAPSDSAIDCASFACISAGAERLKQSQAPESTKNSCSKWLSQLWEQMVSTHVDTTRIMDFAADQGVTPQHMSQAFTSRFGISPRQLEIAKRVELSRIALHTDKTLAEISADYGFSDQSHHARQFRKSHLVTPGEYRRGMQAPLVIMDD